MNNHDDHSFSFKVAVELLSKLADASSERDIVQAVLNRFRSAAHGKQAGLVKQKSMSWSTEYWIGPEPSQLPHEIIATASESKQPVVDKNWIAARLGEMGSTPKILLLEREPGRDSSMDSSLRELTNNIAIVLHLALQVVATNQQLSKKCDRMSIILKFAATWRQNPDSLTLLQSMADASTSLLNAERASIFLWDKKRGVLIGRPALGVESGQLEVDDSAGVVGAVLSSGIPKRWDTSDDEAEVNRKVDKDLEFETRSLLAVPLVNRRGKRIGVFEVINKKIGAFSLEDEQALIELASHASTAIENTQEREQLIANVEKLADEVAGELHIIGESPGITALRETTLRVAKTDLAVLVLGENGTGKEVLARTVHFSGTRRHQPFVAVNCAAIVETLLESELFGHEKGAFTDARDSRQGKFELASNGTLFLDEIGDMSLSGQAKLLRVLEEKVIVRVGGSTPIPIDVRVIAATNQPLANLVREKKFREDLYFRLNVVTLELPPLRDRGRDVILLAEHFLESFANKIGRRIPSLSASAIKALMTHPWPGNIRELRNLIERVSYLCNQSELDASDFAFSRSPRDENSEEVVSTLPLTDATRHFQISHIQRSIERSSGNITDAATNLGLHRSNLYRKMKQLGMETGDDQI